MTIELWSLFSCLVIYASTLGMQALFLQLQGGLNWAFAVRDDQAPYSGVLVARATRCVRNTIEFLALFAPLILIAHLAQVSNPTIEISCGIAVLARLAYLAFYLCGVAYLRSLSWFIAIVPCILIMVALLTA